MLPNKNQPLKPKVYIPELLQQQFALCASYPYIIVQAASGFGKTTTIREYFRQEDTPNVYWYTCMGESVPKAWHNICKLLYPIDGPTAKQLSFLGQPTSDNLVDLAEILSNCQLNVETWLIIDNYQFIQPFLPTRLGLALASHTCSLLHILVITQALDSMDINCIPSNRLALLTNEAFFFSKEDTNTYFRINGIALSYDELDQLQMMSEGWVAVLNLQLLGYLHEGNFKTTDSLNSLIRSVIWNRLAVDEQQFLLAASILVQFTISEAYVLLRSNQLPPEIEQLLNGGSFVHYDFGNGTYLLHSLLQKFLNQEIQQLPPSHIRLLHQLAADAYATVGENYYAMCEYLAADQLDALLSLPLKAADFSLYLQEGSADILEHILLEADRTILVRYPQTLSIITFELFRAGRYLAFQEGCNLMASIIKQPRPYELAPRELQILSGQLDLLLSFSAFNDIERMSILHRRAWESLDGPFSNRVDWNDSWTFGQPSVLYLFWSKSGSLSRELSCMEECLPYYVNLTGGHGTGADCAMQAEALLMKGNDTLAEPLCHKAIYLASSKDQDSICFAAEITLLRIALLRGNIKDYNLIKTSLTRRGQTGHEPTVKVMSDLALASVVTLISQSTIAPWLMDLDKIGSVLYNVALPYGILIHLRWLLSQKQYARILGLAQGALIDANQHHFILPQVYYHLLIAIASNHQALKSEALYACSQALSLALPDHIYLPFAEYYGELLPMLKQQCNHSDLSIITALSRRHRQGVNIISTITSKSRLTPREHEVALLAAGGLTNQDISFRLFISSETVKSTMKNIFRKLDIHSRVQLRDFKGEVFY